MVGTPESIADRMQEWFENGGADGFNLMPPVQPELRHSSVRLSTSTAFERSSTSIASSTRSSSTRAESSTPPRRTPSE